MLQIFSGCSLDILDVLDILRMFFRSLELIIQRSSVPPPSLPSLMVYIIITRDPAHCLMSYPVTVATPTPSHLAITTCQYTCDPIKCCMCVFFVQIHASICFSSYETVCRLVAQNSNHRKSVILYLIITLPVMLALGPSFTQVWVKVINNLLI